MNISPEGTSQSSPRMDLISTGIAAFDEAVGGGLPRGSFILVGGRADTGKTLFASHFLYEGAMKYGEGGIYVSFLESRDTFFEFMKRFGYDLARLEKEEKHRFLGFPTVSVRATIAAFPSQITSRSTEKPCSSCSPDVQTYARSVQTSRNLTLLEMA